MTSTNMKEASAGPGPTHPIWYSMVGFYVVLFAGTGVALVGFRDRWFDSTLPAAVNWLAWAALIPVTFGFALHFGRRLWLQLTVRATPSGLCQSSMPGRTVCVEWAEVVRVERPGRGNLVVVESPAATIRLTQDAYQDPDRLYAYLAEHVPSGTEGYERLSAPVP